MRCKEKLFNIVWILPAVVSIVLVWLAGDWLVGLSREVDNSRVSVVVKLFLPLSLLKYTPYLACHGDKDNVCPYFTTSPRDSHVIAR